jgi:hypothetical protein
VAIPETGEEKGMQETEGEKEEPLTPPPPKENKVGPTPPPPLRGTQQGKIIINTSTLRERIGLTWYRYFTTSWFNTFFLYAFSIKKNVIIWYGAEYWGDSLPQMNKNVFYVLGSKKLSVYISDLIPP